MAAAARDVLSPLVVLAKSAVLEVAELSTCALANLLLDTEVSEKAVTEEIILPATRVLREGTMTGKTHAAAGIARLLRSRKIDHNITDCVNSAGTVLALVSFLGSADTRTVSTSEALDALAILSRSEGVTGNMKPTWAVLAEFPQSISPIVASITDATPILQDKAIEVLARLCRDQPGVIGEEVVIASGCIASVSRRVINSTDVKVKIGGTALLVCAAKVNHHRLLEDLHTSSSCSLLIQSLVAMLSSSQTSALDNQSDTDKEFISIYRLAKEDNDGTESNKSTAVVYGVNLAIWLLCLLACHDGRSKTVIMEAGAVEVLTEGMSNYYSQYAQVINFLRPCSFSIFMVLCLVFYSVWFHI